MEEYLVQEKFFFVMGAMSLGLDKRVPLTHSTSILKAQIPSQPATHPSQHREACFLRAVYSEGATALPDLA